MKVFRSNDEVKELLESLDSENFYSPDRIGTYTDLLQLETTISKLASDFQIDSPFRMVLLGGDGYQDGSLCSSARIVDGNLMHFSGSGDKNRRNRVLSMLEEAKAEIEAMVLEVLFSKFGLATVINYDKERAKDIYPGIERVILGSDFKLIDYSAIKEFRYTGKVPGLTNYTWFERYFLDVFYK